MTELIKSTHPAFRPIDVKMGPDGAIYISSIGITRLFNTAKSISAIRAAITRMVAFGA